VERLKAELFPRATLLTPNLDEAEILLGERIRSLPELQAAARELHRRFGCAVLVKGGHLRRLKQATDIFVSDSGELVLRAAFVRSVNTHGTGCTFSAAITAYLARGRSLRGSVIAAKEHITLAIRHTRRIGAHSVLGRPRAHLGWSMRYPTESVPLNFMKCAGLVLCALAHAVALSSAATNPTLLRFKYERYGAQDGALYDDIVKAVFLDSKGRVWAGTVTGLAIFDRNIWTKRTFKMSGLPLGLRFLGITNFGPRKIVEGPPDTIWLGGDFGVWRVRNDSFEEIGSSPEMAGMLDMALDRDVGLWVVKKSRVCRFNGRTWTTVLCPYIGKPKSREAPGLQGIAIGTNGVVWIGGTVYGEPKEPWEHEAAIWLVDQERKERNDGPPMAPLFEFNGKRWRAFGPLDGLNVKWAIPRLDEQDRLTVKTPKGNYIREDGTWKPVKEYAAFVDKRWILRERKRGLLRGYSELLFRDGEHPVEVQPKNARSGEVLEVRSEQLTLLHIAEDQARNCVWLGTPHGLYRIWLEEQGGLNEQ
jgi:hypothetical protein